jgi:hypothetical protein
MTKIIMDCGEPMFQEPVHWYESGLCDCSVPGPCDGFVDDFICANDVTCDDVEGLAHWLEDFGAWDDTELADHAANIQRAVWIMSGNVRDDAGCYASIHNVEGVDNEA